jgi:NDP-sugar pyrophosphorylase family protein
MGEQVQAMFGATYGGLYLAYSQEESPLGTAGALRLALPLLASDPVLILNGDSFCDMDLHAFWRWYDARETAGALLLHKTFDTTRYGRVRVDNDGRVLRFDEKSDHGGPGWMNAGIYLLSRRLLLTIPMRRAVSLEREMFPAWIGRGLYSYCSEGRFLDIGIPEAYATAEQFFARETQP